MIQLSLFPRHAEEALAAIQRERLYEGVLARLRTAPDPFPGPPDAFQAAWAALPAGVLDFPTPPVGDPAYEVMGFVLVDVPRVSRRGIAAHHRRTGGR